MATRKEIEKDVLESLQTKREISASLKKRSGLVLLYHYESKRKSEIMLSEGLPATTINRWLDRWDSREEDKEQWYNWYESEEISKKKYKILLQSIFQDIQRPGTPAKFTEEIIEKIMALAVTNPESLGLPYSKWSEALLKKELEKRKIVKSISTSQIGRFLKMSSSETSSE